ncbi:MAG: carbon-nitrogen hydrolase family protein [Planctomycetota bacterium]
MSNELTVGLAQIAPHWLRREPTLQKVADWIRKGGEQGCDLLVFGECLVPGYPFWLEHTGGARFNNDLQKQLYAHYLSEAVDIDAGHLDPVCQAARDAGTMVMLGCYERPRERGGHSGYCSLVTISREGEVLNSHRKIMPTYDERLVWAIGDGHGLRTFPLGDFTVGGLNCWENWLPLLRASLLGMGEDLHVAVWPGSPHNTVDITRFAAMEGRSFVVSVSGLLGKEHVPDDIPHAELLRNSLPEWMGSGGSCLAGPDGAWLIEPLGAEEKLVTATVAHDRVLQERQNLDVVGHYSRPDITRLVLNRDRQSTLHFENGSDRLS